MTYTYETPKGGVFESNYALTKERSADIWFCEGGGIVNAIGDYYYGNGRVTIYCLGEMRLNLADGTVWRSAWDLPSNITNDEELMNVWSAPENDVVNNCWIELFDTSEGQDVENEETYIICGDIWEAIDEAHAYLVATYPEVEG